MIVLGTLIILVGLVYALGSASIPDGRLLILGLIVFALGLFNLRFIDIVKQENKQYKRLLVENSLAEYDSDGKFTMLTDEK